MTTATTLTMTPELARINGVPLLRPDEALDPTALRQRACTELLRQAAIRAGLLSPADAEPTDGAVSDEASAAIEALLERELPLPDPSEDACRRLYDAHPARYAIGERVLARHVLFAVTPGLDVAALRQRAEACLLDLRCQVAPDGAVAEDRFSEVARTQSNCPSGEQGGALGWLSAGDCAPELGAELFGHPEVGVLPRLVRSRFGLHVVEVLAREPGTVPPFESVRPALAQALQRQAFATALRQYLQLLAGQAHIVGVALEAADSPLVQ